MKTQNNKPDTPYIGTCQKKKVDASLGING